MSFHIKKTLARYSGKGRNPATTNIPRSGQNRNVDENEPMMNCKFLQVFFCWVVGTILLTLSVNSGAQSTGLLYDPEPPANSAYVRVIHASREGSVDVMVDGKPRARNLKGGEASDYLVLSAGKHTFALQAAGQSTALVSATLDVDSGHAITVAFTTLRADTKPLVFEDKANSNKLKAVLAVYHLDSKSGPLDVLSADGKIRVFTKVVSGTSSQLSVNPITIELIATQSGDKTAQARATVAMEPGGTYSFMLLPGEGGKLIARAVQNKVERYTGK